MDPIVAGVVRKSIGVVAVIKEFDMLGVPDKWLALMNHIRHSAPAVYQLTFADRDTAEKSARKIYTTMVRNPTWFEVEIIRKGCDVYIIKKDCIQKAVVKHA